MSSPNIPEFSLELEEKLVREKEVLSELLILSERVLKLLSAEDRCRIEFFLLSCLTEAVLDSFPEAGALLRDQYIKKSSKGIKFNRLDKLVISEFREVAEKFKELCKSLTP